MYLTKSVRNVKIAFLYIIKQVKILSYKVTTLNFMYDIYIYIYIREEAHITDVFPPGGGGGEFCENCMVKLYSRTV